jgi:hypothetical protein
MGYGYPGEACTAKRSVLSLISMITVTLMIVAIILFLIGEVFVHAELSNFFDDQDNIDNDDDYGYNAHYDPANLTKGYLDIGIAIIILLCTRTFLGFTINNRQWWQRLKGVMEAGCSWNMETTRLRRNISEIYGLLYGTIIIFGTMLFIFGIIFINVTQSAMIFVACGDVAIGALIIFIAYKLYIREITRLSREIYPLLKPSMPKKVEKY